MTGEGWNGRRALVTGATGVVGSWLVKELLAAGAGVVALVLDSDPQSELVRSGDIDRCTVVNGSLEDILTLERAIAVHEPDTIFHFGAQTQVGAAQRAPLPTWEANVRGTYNLLEACRRQAEVVQRIVVASSDKAYGEAELLPYTESTPLAARHPYDVSKACADMIAQCYHHSYGLPIAIARCGNIYGGGDLNWARIVPGTIRSFHRSERPVLRSDGTFVRDYVYVRDAAFAYMQLAERASEEGVRGEAFNFSDGRPLTVLELVAAIAREMDVNGIDPLVLGTASGEIRAQTLSAEKARERLDWKPAYTLDRGLRETIAWYRGILG